MAASRVRVLPECPKIRTARRSLARRIASHAQHTPSRVAPWRYAVVRQNVGIDAFPTLYNIYIYI
jgi:hypothetical protein